MASTNWIEIYESYSAAELAQEIADLKAAAKEGSNFTAQSVGGKSYQADLSNIEAKLAAAVRVQTNAGGSARNRVGVANFGNLGGCS